jgi:hypothetical protein
MNPNYPKKSDARAHTRITRGWFCPKPLHLFNSSRNQWVGSRISLHPAFIGLHRKAMREPLRRSRSAMTSSAAQRACAARLCPSTGSGRYGTRLCPSTGSGRYGSAGLRFIAPARPAAALRPSSRLGSVLPPRGRVNLDGVPPSNRIWVTERFFWSCAAPAAAKGWFLLKQSKSGKRDFSAAKTLIKEGRLSMRAISRRYGIPERTLRRHAEGSAQRGGGHQKSGRLARNRPWASLTLNRNIFDFSR